MFAYRSNDLSASWIGHRYPNIIKGFKRIHHDTSCNLWENLLAFPEKPHSIVLFSYTPCKTLTNLIYCFNYTFLTSSMPQSRSPMSHCINNSKNSLHYAYEINTSMPVQLVSFPIFVILYRPRLNFLKSFLKELLVDDYRDFKFKHDKSVGLNKSTQLNFILHLELHLIRSQTAKSL